LAATGRARGPGTDHEDLVSVTAAARVDARRLWLRHEAMARHGATAAGGVNRQALSVQEAQAWQLLIGWGRELGLMPATDAVGNLFLRWPGRDPLAAPVLTGSHLDSQPTGGRFDGVYGVLAGLEAVQALQEAAHVPARPIDIVAWMNEEGARFAPRMMGSSVFSGARGLQEVLAVTDADGVAVAEALADHAAAFADLPCWPLQRPVHAYLEAHIEQGPLLEREGLSVGIVTGIQGKRTFSVTVAGQEAHAGTTPSSQRQDALLAAVRIISGLVAWCHDPQDLVRFTVGRLDVLPNAPSVVPASVRFSIDLRHPDSQRLCHLGDGILAVCEAQAGPCRVTVTELSNAQSLEFPASIRQLLSACANDLQISHMDILSAAGHDARYLHEVCPTGMIFVPCKGGVSHNEAESATASDLAAGARVLTQALVALTR
jgi:N-carbamoyl-L-amino-acid hydrolase